MKKLISLSLLFLFIFSFSESAVAQSSVAVFGSYGRTNQHAISKGFSGGGIQYRHFLKPNIAVGLSGKYLIENFDRKLALKTIRGQATNVPVNLFAEYYFLSKGIRPYAGLEAGVDIQKIEGYNIVVDKTSVNPGLAPKIGVVLPMGSRLQFMVEASYRVVLGSANSVNVDPVKIGDDLYSVKNSKQSVTANAGFRFVLGKVEKKVKVVEEP